MTDDDAKAWVCTKKTATHYSSLKGMHGHQRYIFRWQKYSKLEKSTTNSHRVHPQLTGSTSSQFANFSSHK
jgi:hypothetical protein